jgi:hypothetical protein
LSRTFVTLPQHGPYNQQSFTDVKSALPQQRAFCASFLHRGLYDGNNFFRSIHIAGDQLLGAHCCAQAAGCADRIIDHSQIIYHLDSTNLSNYSDDEIEYMFMAY